MGVLLAVGTWVHDVLKRQRPQIAAVRHMGGWLPWLVTALLVSRPSHGAVGGVGVIEGLPELD